jgi:hypothetical protein
VNVKASTVSGRQQNGDVTPIIPTALSLLDITSCQLLFGNPKAGGSKVLTNTRNFCRFNISYIIKLVWRVIERQVR